MIRKYSILHLPSSIILLTSSILLFTSCISTKKVSYFQNKDEIDATLSRQLYDAKIMPKDIVQIQAFSMTPGMVEPFNLLKTAASASSTTPTETSVYNYLVDNEGCVEMPILSKVKIGGMTKNEAEEHIKSLIQPYMAESEQVVVHVRMVNYKYAILGGVNKPGLYTTQNEKVSILEAIAQAGDLNLYAERDQIYLIRENSDGQKEFHQLNINDANIIASPYYYLQQNDVIYVEQKKVVARNAFFSSSTSIWMSITSMLTSLATFIIAVVK